MLCIILLSQTAIVDPVDQSTQKDTQQLEYGSKSTEMALKTDSKVIEKVIELEKYQTLLQLYQQQSLQLNEQIIQHTTQTLTW